jgi:N-sulfoglucosamine sulfohydrolase
VAIAASEMLCRRGFTQKALPVLERYLKDRTRPTVVLQAAISTRNLGAGAAPLIPVIEEIYPQYRGEVSGRYKNWLYPMFIGFALDQAYLNCGLEVPE